MNKLQGKMMVVEGKEAEVAHSASTLHQQVTQMEFDQILIKISKLVSRWLYNISYILPLWFISKKFTKEEMISPYIHWYPKKLLEGEKYESMKDSIWWYETYLYALLTL